MDSVWLHTDPLRELGRCPKTKPQEGSRVATEEEGKGRKKKRRGGERIGPQKDNRH